MTAAAVPIRPALPNIRPRPRLAMIAGVLGAAGLVAAVASRPRLELLFGQPQVIQLHVYAAIGAVMLGAVILAARKGRAFHRVAGWGWVTLMALTAGASLFIVGLNGDHWSWIHILSGWTLIALPLALIFIKRGKVRMHARMMTGLYIGGMIIAGAFTFIPGRLMWTIFFS